MVYNIARREELLTVQLLLVHLMARLEDFSSFKARVC